MLRILNYLDHNLKHNIFDNITFYKFNVSKLNEDSHKYKIYSYNNSLC